MRNFILTICLLFSSLAHSQPGLQADAAKVNQNKANLFTFRETIDDIYSSTSQLKAELSDSASRYDSLGFFDFSEKAEIAQSGCTQAKGTMGGAALMLASVLDVTQETLRTTASLNTANANRVIQQLNTFSQVVRELDSVCNNPRALVAQIQKSQTALKHVKIFVDAVIPETL